MGTCVFLERNIDHQLNSDMSSDLLHGWILHRDGEVLSNDWYYSTELQVVHTYLLFAPLFHLFEDWHTVRVLGSILWYLALLLSAYYVCRQCRMARVFPVVGILLMLPISSPYYDNIIKGIYYVPYLCGSLLVFGMTLQCAHLKRRDMLITLLAGLGLLSFVLGMSGMRMLLVLFIPLLIMAFVNAWIQNQNKLKGPDNSLLYASLVGSGSGFAGCAVTLTVLSKIYSFRDLTDLYFVDFSVDRIITVINDWLIFWGYRGGKAFSRVLLHNVFALVLILALIFVILSCLKNKNCRFELRLLVLFYGIGMILYAALVAVTTVPYHITYQLPIGIFGILLAVSILNENTILSKVRGRVYQAVIWLVIFGLIGCGALEYRAYAQVDKTVDLRQVANQLVEENYSAGYTSFWCGNILTELSDGQLDMYVWEDYGSEDVNEMYHWLQEKRHDTETPQGRVCIVLEAKVANRYPVYQWLSEDKLIYSGEHLVYGFESYAEMISHIEANKMK